MNFQKKKYYEMIRRISRYSDRLIAQNALEFVWNDSIKLAVDAIVNSSAIILIKKFGFDEAQVQEYSKNLYEILEEFADFAGDGFGEYAKRKLASEMIEIKEEQNDC